MAFSYLSSYLHFLNQLFKSFVNTFAALYFSESSLYLAPEILFEYSGEVKSATELRIQNRENAICM